MICLNNSSPFNYDFRILTQLYAEDKIETDDVRKNVIEKEVERMLNRDNTIEKDYSLEEMKKAISRLKNNKAGPVPAEMIKASPLHMLSTLLKIINKIKNKCYFPKLWANGITSLLHKEGDQDDPNNYRGITVASALAKILAIMMNERIIAKLEEEKIIKQNQIAFQKKSRPADHLFVLKNIFQNYTSKGKKLFTCFVDFRKAYDSVWRTGMYYKLIKSGININTVKLIKDMYDKTSQTLKMNNKITEAFSTHKGVRQGCVLSPILFNVFINDLPEIFDADCSPVMLGDTRISCLMFADDIVMLSESKEGLENGLKQLQGYTQDWNLSLNTKKTKIMVIQNTGKMPTINIKFDGQTLGVVDRYKYLGTIISRTGNFKLNENYLKGKGLRARYAITKSIGLDCKVSTLLRIFQRMVEPILLYNCEVALACIPKTWTLEKFKVKMWEGKEIDKVLKGFIRQILGLNKKTSNMGILAETGKYPLSVNIYVQMMKYWVRLLTTDSLLLKEAHMDNMERYARGNPCWIKPIIYLLKITQTEPIDVAEIFQNRTSFIINVSKKIKDIYTCHWKNEAADKTEGKLKFYLQLKKNFAFEKYLDTIPRVNRKDTTRLRLSSHSLPIEKMRSEEISREERKCTLCELNEVGDEWHYISRCENNKIQVTRSKFIERVKNIQPQLADFQTSDLMKYCISMCDTSIHDETTRFIKTLMKEYDVEDEENRIPDSCCMM